MQRPSVTAFGWRLSRGRTAWTAALLVVLGLLGGAAVWFSGLQTQMVGAQSPCGNGTVVRQPADHPALVADCETLLEAKDALRGTAALNWGANIALMSWDGITLGSLDDMRRVTELDMDGQGLNGTIPAQLGQLSGLRELRLAWGNQLTGSIPPELGRNSPASPFSTWPPTICPARSRPSWARSARNSPIWSSAHRSPCRMGSA